MTKFCCVTSKKSITGNKRSHAMNITKRKFLPNLHYHRFWYSKEKRFIRLRVTAKGMKIIDKNGIEKFLLKN
ncbi:MAG: 50S ribosomal protein L28 [Candidatus Lightella neohaematopini]|nr:50S ribosomal protein L28 [Candidatus Lightella neohaematopini]MCV2528868.1 50S ribosomal protein L28 [Candidatus Lightella neohaematopini]